MDSGGTTIVILSNKTILKKIKEQELIIEPLKQSQQSASIDLRIGNHFLTIDEYSTPLISLDKPAA
ncbi:dCTP deaminase domain-containing protein [Peribacillus frigoritolerans]|uniref:dCTP deaminase domain-containing protein n=1 Tax=Peribacillus frigoritolerans TaxID=450367 RepID=UPI0007BEFE48